MVSNEIRNNAAALGVLMHQVSEEQAAMLRLIKTNLVAAADTAEELERGLAVPEAPAKTVRTGVIGLVMTKNGPAAAIAILPEDCSGVCDGCAHAEPKEAANGQN